MTIGGWILFNLLFVLIVVVCALIAYTLYYKMEHTNKKGLYRALIVFDMVLCGAMIVGVLCAQLWYYENTASGQRAFKDQESNFENGTNRVVTVYDINGEVIKQYDGRFDVETGNVDNAPYILFDDENGKRHIIYYTTGTVTIDEK